MAPSPWRRTILFCSVTSCRKLKYGNKNNSIKPFQYGTPCIIWKFKKEISHEKERMWIILVIQKSFCFALSHHIGSSNTEKKDKVQIFCEGHKYLAYLSLKIWRYYSLAKFRMNLWGRHFSQNANQKLPGFLPWKFIKG